MLSPKDLEELKRLSMQPPFHQAFIIRAYCPERHPIVAIQMITDQGVYCEKCDKIIPTVKLQYVFGDEPFPES